jgi:voltage-gated potassium channel
MKQKIKIILENKYVDFSLIALIVFNVICIGLETEKTIYLAHKSFFYHVEVLSVTIFFAEYLMRLLTLNKVGDVAQPLMLVDLFAILPFFLPTVGLDLRVLRIFRLLRILRMFKLARYFNALQTIAKVLLKKRVELISIFGVLVFLIFLSSFLMYYAESDAQPDAFNNILDTFWWSVVTFTTVGYGDVYPVTAIGKILSALIVLIGIMLFALPTSILTAEFLNALDEKNNDA